MLVLTLVFSTNSYRAMSPGSNVRGGITTTSEVNRADLYRKIQAYSDKHEFKSIDAKVDRVWKAIPGYNGLSVNIKAKGYKLGTVSELMGEKRVN
jgi:peptidoglycan-N-acetylglucosamine deacetylase